MAKDKTPPKWVVYVVMAVITGAYIIYSVLRGGNFFLPGLFILLFAFLAGLWFLISGFNAWVNWRQRRKAADSAPE